jgi:hypothetical protein
MPNSLCAFARCICAKGSRTDSERSNAWDKISWDYARARIDLGAPEVASESNPNGISELERSARYWLEVCMYHFYFY